MMNIMHHGGGLQALVSMWQLGFLFVGLEMAQGSLGLRQCFGGVHCLGGSMEVVEACDVVVWTCLV